MQITQIVCVAIAAAIILLSLLLSILNANRTQVGNPDFVHRLLYPWLYLTPAERRCACHFKNPPTSLMCENPAHPRNPPLSMDLSQPGEFFTREGVRTNGVRVLCALVLAAALVISQAPILFAILVIASWWLVMPIMLCGKQGLAVFTFLLASVATIVGYVRYVGGIAALHNLGQPPSQPLPQGQIGFVHFDLGIGAVTNGAVLLNVLCAATLLIGTILSVISQNRNRSPDFDGPITVGIMGILVSIILLLLLSVIQRLDGFTTLYKVLAVIALGWLISAFLERAVIGSLSRVRGPYGPRVRAFQFAPLPPPARPTRQPRVANDLFENLANTLERVAVSVVYAAMRATTDLANALLWLGNLMLRIVAGAINIVLAAIFWLLAYLREVFKTLALDMLKSLPALFRLATAGFRVTVYAPALAVLASVLFFTSADMGIEYLQQGQLPQLGWAIFAFVAAAGVTTFAGSIFVDWRVTRSLLRVSDDYFANALLFFAFYLDLYGIERRVTNMPSHFGLISWLLNLLLVGVVLWLFLFRRRPAKQTP